MYFSRPANNYQPNLKGGGPAADVSAKHISFLGATCGIVWDIPGSKLAVGRGFSKPETLFNVGDDGEAATSLCATLCLGSNWCWMHLDTTPPAISRI
jgi:hypothetical protein